MGNLNDGTSPKSGLKSPRSRHEKEEKRKKAGKDGENEEESEDYYSFTLNENALPPELISYLLSFHPFSLLSSYFPSLVRIIPPSFFLFHFLSLQTPIFFIFLLVSSCSSFI